MSNLPIVPFSAQPVSGALVAAGLWMRLGLASMLLAGGALAGLVQGEIGALPALAAIAGSAAVAVASWRRGAAALDRGDADAEPRGELVPARDNRVLA